MKPHKHAELIKAWADGAEIEEKFLNENWKPFDGKWSEDDAWSFRIKSKLIAVKIPKPYFECDQEKSSWPLTLWFPNQDDQSKAVQAFVKALK